MFVLKKKDNNNNNSFFKHISSSYSSKFQGATCGREPAWEQVVREATTTNSIALSKRVTPGSADFCLSKLVCSVVSRLVLTHKRVDAKTLRIVVNLSDYYYRCCY